MKSNQCDRTNIKTIWLFMFRTLKLNQEHSNSTKCNSNNILPPSPLQTHWSTTPSTPCWPRSNRLLYSMSYEIKRKVSEREFSRWAHFIKAVQFHYNPFVFTELYNFPHHQIYFSWLEKSNYYRDKWLSGGRYFSFMILLF